MESHATHRHPKMCGDLFVTHSLISSQHKHPTCVFRQLFQRLDGAGELLRTE
jgi:hypothetical protein